METDLPGDGRFVLTERSGNSGLGRVVANTDLDDPSFIEGDVKMLIRRSHKRYLRSKRGIQIWTKIMIHAGRVNATCSSWRLNATLSPLELHLLFHFTLFSGRLLPLRTIVSSSARSRYDPSAFRSC